MSDDAGGVRVRESARRAGRSISSFAGWLVGGVCLQFLPWPNARKGQSIVISGKTLLIAHLGFPTETFKSPLIYNPFFEKSGIDAVVVPMGVQAVDFPSFLPELLKVTNLRGALVTMPHKMTAIELADEVSPTARIAGAANVLLKREDGSLVADIFDGEGFVRGVLRKGRIEWHQRADHRFRRGRVGDRGVAGGCGGEADGFGRCSGPGR